MNDDQEINDDQLRQATSRIIPPGEPLDRETSALREVWLGLGRSLETAGHEFDHESVAARLQAALIDHPERVQPAAKAASRTWWPVLVGTALALAMLLAVISSLPLGDSNDGSDDRPVVASSPNDPLELAAWSDPLDDEIDEATAQVQALATQAPGIDDSLLGISEQLESMSDELLHGSL